MIDNKEEDYITYLGDGLYVKFDGYQIVLLSNDPKNPTNEVYLEQSVFNQLINYANTIWNKEE